MSLSSDEQSVRDVVALWHSATAAGDVDIVLSLMSDDVVFLVAGHPPMRGRASFERGLRTLLTKSRIESTAEVQEVAVSGTLAYCWSNLTVRWRVGTLPFVRAARCRSFVSNQMGNGSWCETPTCCPWRDTPRVLIQRCASLFSAQTEHATTPLQPTTVRQRYLRAHASSHCVSSRSRCACINRPAPFATSARACGSLSAWPLNAAPSRAALICIASASR